MIELLILDVSKIFIPTPKSTICQRSTIISITRKNQAKNGLMRNGDGSKVNRNSPKTITSRGRKSTTKMIEGKAENAYNAYRSLNLSSVLFLLRSKSISKAKMMNRRNRRLRLRINPEEKLKDVL
ncbi:MAG: hypothetical protein HUU54_05060 [Ignavibacteriaceae bacterium]|nr:hypothetical protein [Ignavibacteriaceae bacterium]